MPDKSDERKATLAEYEALYNRFKVLFETNDGFNENWSSQPEFQRLLFNLEIRKNLEKAKLEVDFKLKDMIKELEVLKNSRKIDTSENISVLVTNKDDIRVKDNKRLYAQQKLARQKNLINRLKLSLLNIFKNLQMDEKFMKSDNYLNMRSDDINESCNKFLNQCVYEKMIFDNISEQFKGKVDFDTIKQILESGKPNFNYDNKENEDMSYMLQSQREDEKSYYSGSENVSKNQINS